MKSAADRRKVVIVTNMPAPYRTEQMNLLSRSDQFQFKVFFYAKNEPNRLWRSDDLTRSIAFDHEFLGANPVRSRWGLSYFVPKLFLKLWAERPWAIVVSGFSFQLLLSLIYARLAGAKVLVWSDSNIASELRLPRWRTLIRRLLVRGTTCAIAASGSGLDYFIFLGVPKNKIVISRLVADWHHLKKVLPELRARRQEVRAELGIGRDEIVVLLPSRLEPEKGCHELLKAVADIRYTVPRVRLLLAGDGSLRASLEDTVRTLAIHDMVILTGFVQYDDMPRLYAASDLVVFPTFRDHYGAIVVEALTANLPVACSKYAGASDLIAEGRNGMVFDPGDHEELCAALKESVRRVSSGNWPGSLPMREDITPEAANRVLESALLL